MNKENQDLSKPQPTTLDGFPARMSQAILHSGLKQTEFANQMGISPGFLSDVVRGNKKPGAEFLYALRTTFGFSIDWLLTGLGTRGGLSPIDLELFKTIQLQIALVQAAIERRDPHAKILLELLRSEQLASLEDGDSSFGELLNSLDTGDTSLDLILELYNGCLGNADPVARYQDLLESVITHFESKKPLDKLAALMRAHKGGTLQINLNSNSRNAGRDFHEK